MKLSHSLPSLWIAGTANANTGHVKWFNDNRGFGFITQDSDKTDVFVHYSAIQVRTEFGLILSSLTVQRKGDGFKTLSDGQAVEYDVEETQRGPTAINVQVV